MKHGGFPAVAKALGFNAEFLRQVAKKRRRVSADTALYIEAATDGDISKSDLRPDYWPPEESQNRGAA
ncbi:YdaS family helix-turn-helix protein [Acidithiobacillus montserratensis]|uniref:YdaS family helix-turn-helix protein n=1 Tax=Acidithiobacillus montserratensis TaxID=2729135 RepID=A0ACD5HIE9_9PROT|nr:YdaS family helix-turn-helix protein [Acidithiobacillus montserratensis]MBU2748629.1 helix-turn-helix domain-containing protein [Acidithiobacillus montserratensis]